MRKSQFGKVPGGGFEAIGFEPLRLEITQEIAAPVTFVPKLQGNLSSLSLHRRRGPSEKWRRGRQSPVRKNFLAEFLHFQPRLQEKTMAAAPERLTWINDLVHTSVRGFILS